MFYRLKREGHASRGRKFPAPRACGQDHAVSLQRLTALQFNTDCATGLCQKTCHLSAFVYRDTAGFGRARIGHAEIHRVHIAVFRHMQCAHMTCQIEPGHRHIARVDHPRGKALRDAQIRDPA